MDWRAFCDEYRIETREGGSSTKKNNIYVECPWCRNGKHRLGMSCEAPFYWGCWLDKKHRGKSPVRLIMVLAGVSYEEACDIGGIQKSHQDLMEILAEFESFKKSLERSKKVSNVHLNGGPVSDYREYDTPSSWFDLRPRGKLSRPFINYLVKRGLPPECCTRYQLMASASRYGHDRYRDRVISPIVIAGQTVAITARSIKRKASYRYLTDPAKVPDEVLYNTQHATGAEILVLVEGPYDVKKLDWVAFSRELPIHVVGSMGIVLSRKKEASLQRLMKNYRRTVVLFDRAALMQAMELQTGLYREIEIGQVPDNVKDPGAFTLRAAGAFLMNILH